MPLLKWLRSITEELFATAERPIFLITNLSLHQDFTNYFCHLLAILGANVVVLNGQGKADWYNANYYDGIFDLRPLANGVEVLFLKNYPESCNKTYKKTFPLSTFNFLGAWR